MISPTTASLVDSMLELTRVKPEHADLVGVACLRIAAKMVGAVELQPTQRELCINCDNTFSEQDLDRMETIVYNKLQGQFHKVVPFDFLSELLQLAAHRSLNRCAHTSAAVIDLSGVLTGRSNCPGDPPGHVGT